MTNTGRYRKWFVLAAGFSTCSLVVSFLFNMSILYVEWLREFKRSKSETSLIQSVCTGTFYIGGLLSGICITKYGCRKCGLVGGLTSAAGILASYFATSIPYLVIFFGISGFGFSLSFISAMSSVQLHFEGRWKIIALAFMEFGSGLSASLTSLSCEQFIKEFGWRGTFLIEGAIMLNIIPSAIIFSSTVNSAEYKQNTNVQIVKDKQENSVNETHSPITTTGIRREDFDMSQVPESNTGSPVLENMDVSNCKLNDDTRKHGNLKNSSDFKNQKQFMYIFKSIFKDKLFVIYIILIATSATSFNSVLIFIFDYLTSKHISNPDAVNIFVYMNIVNTISRMVPGFLKNVPHVSILFIPVLSTFLGCVATAIFPFIGSSKSLNILVACSFAFGMGSIATAMSISAAKLLEKAFYSSGLGVSFATIGIFLVIGGPISGYIRDKTGNYDASLLSASAVFFVSCVLFSIMMVYRYRRPQSTHTNFDINSQSRRLP